MAKLSLLPLLLLSSVSFANSVPRYIIKSDGTVYDALTSAKGGRITFKAKEGATIARAYEDMRCTFSPIGSEGILGFVVNSHSGPFQSRVIGIDDFGNAGPYASVDIKTDLITSIGLPKITPKIAKEHHGKFRMAGPPEADPEISFSMSVLDRRLKLVDYSPEENEAARKLGLKQKAWLTPNFRMRIGHLPASLVSELSEISIQQSTCDLDGDGLEELNRTVSPISFTIPASDAGPYMEWFRAAMQGKAGAMPLHIEYMDDERSFLALDLMVQPVSVDFADLFTDPYLPDGSVVVKVVQVDQQKLDSILSLIR